MIRKKKTLEVTLESIADSGNSSSETMRFLTRSATLFNCEGFYGSIYRETDIRILRSTTGSSGILASLVQFGKLSRD